MFQPYELLVISGVGWGFSVKVSGEVHYAAAYECLRLEKQSRPEKRSVMFERFVLEGHLHLHLGSCRLRVLKLHRNVENEQSYSAFCKGLEEFRSLRVHSVKDSISRV